MPERIDLLVLALGLLAAGTISFVLGAGDLARRSGANPFALGLLVLVLGAATPGLAFNLSAAGNGKALLGHWAMGNLVGTTVVNVGLALGLAAVVRPIAGTARLVSAAIVFLILTTLLFWFFCRGHELGRLEAAILLAGFVGAVTHLSRVARLEPEAVRLEFANWIPTSRSRWIAIVLVVLGLALLFNGVVVAIRIAELVSQLHHQRFAQWFIAHRVGLIAAVGTSLPVVIVAVVAAHRGLGNLALVVVVGASLSNLLLVAGISAMVQPITNLEWTVMNEAPAMALFTLLLVAPLANGLRVSRWEGVVLLAAFSAFVAWQLWRF